MKQRSLFAPLLVFIFFGAFYSCSKTGPQGPQGPQGSSGPSYEGTIAGNVSLYDQYGNQITINLAGISITLDSLGQDIASATTNGTGFYVFPNRFTGTYSAFVQNPSVSPEYGSIQSTSIQFISDTLYRNFSLSAQASFAPATLSAAINTVAAVDTVSFTITPDTQARDVIVFAGNSSSVSSTNYIYAFVMKVNANVTMGYNVIQASTLFNYGFASGDTIYFAAYGEPVNDKTIYLDELTGQNVYTALSTSSVSTSTLVP